MLLPILLAKLLFHKNNTPILKIELSALFLKAETIFECRHCLNNNLWSIYRPEIESDAVDGSGEGEAAESQEDQDKVGKQWSEVYHVTARLHALDNRGLARLNQEDQDKVGKQWGEVYHVTARLHALDKQRACKTKEDQDKVGK
jgi:hypothetical protein